MDPCGELEYASLVCRCGHDSFRLSGWPRIATAGGSFFWRSVTRVWREARLAMENGEPVESPFWLPIFVRCDRCEREVPIFDGAHLEGRLGDAGQKEPRESFRCRICRRGRLQVVVGVAAEDEEAERVDIDVFVKCRACERPFHIAWSRGRPSAQERRLDLLYGRS